MSKQALYVPAKADFVQPAHGQGKTTSAKNKTKVGFKQNPAIGAAGKTSSKKNPGKVPFKQKTAAKTGNSSKKNAGKADFSQPNRAGKNVSMPTPAGGSVMKGSKGGKPKIMASASKVAPKMGAKFTSVDAITSYRKKKYGV